MQVNNDKQIQKPQVDQNYNIGRNQLGKNDKQMQSIFAKYDTDGDGKINTSNAKGVNELEGFMSDYNKMLSDGNADKEQVSFFTNIYNKIVNLMKPENKNKIYEDGNEIEANGVLENSEQGRIGDCWLHSQVNALKDTDFGKDAIKNAIQKNEDGSYTVKFKGVNKSYTFSSEEIQSKIDENVYSKGDLDYKLIEMGVEKLYDEQIPKEIEKELKIHRELSKDGFKEAAQDSAHRISELINKRDHKIKSIAGGAGSISISDKENEIAYLLGADCEQTSIDSPSGIEGALIKKAKSSNEVAINFGSYYDIEKREPFNKKLPEADEGHEYSIKNVKLDENENIVQVDVINPWDNSKSIPLTLEEFHAMRAPDENISVSGTKGKVKELEDNKENYKIKDFVNKCKQPDSTWADFTIMDDIKNKKDLIKEFGGLKLYITELNKAMDKTAEDEHPLSQTDKTVEGEHLLSQSDKTLEGEHPLSQTDKTVEGEHPLSQSDKTVEDEQPLSQSDKTVEGDPPLSQSDKTTEDEPPLSQSDKTTILTNMYCDNLHFSKKDAKDLVEHPEKMQQYCIKYGYKY